MAGEEEAALEDMTEFNTGITVVLPIAQVIEVLEIPRLKELRVKAVKEYKKASGYRSASVSKGKTLQNPPMSRAANDLTGDDILRAMLNTPPSPRKGDAS